MKKVFVIAVILSSLSCSKERISGNGAVTTEQRNVSNFTSINTAGSTRVHISEGAVFKVEVKGYSNLLPYYETKLVNNELRLGFKTGVNIKNDNTEVFVTLPVLEGVKLSGSGDISATGTFPAVNDLYAEIAGSGNINLSQGSAVFLHASIAGSGNIDAHGILADKVETFTSGSGNTEVSVNSHLSVKISGSGNVYYYGNPLIVTNISGSGAVIPK